MLASKRHGRASAATAHRELCRGRVDEICPHMVEHCHRPRARSGDGERIEAGGEDEGMQ